MSQEFWFISWYIGRFIAGYFGIPQSPLPPPLPHPPWLTLNICSRSLRSGLKDSTDVNKCDINAMKHRKGYSNIIFWFPVIFCLIFVAKHCASRRLHKISSVTSMSNWRFLSFIFLIFIVAVPFLSITSSIIWAYGSWREEISLQLALTCFLSLDPSGQSNETNSKQKNK